MTATLLQQKAIRLEAVMYATCIGVVCALDLWLRE